MGLLEWISSHPDDVREEEYSTEAVSELIRVAEREVIDAVSVRSSEGTLGHAHNSVLAIAAAALRENGFRVRSGSSSHHYRLIESLEFTLHIEPGIIKELQDYRRKRSLSIYEQSGVVSETEAQGALDAAKGLLARYKDSQ